MKRIRIQTADTTKATVSNLAKVAKQNKRSAGKEALIAIESHIINQLALIRTPQLVQAARTGGIQLRP